MISLRQRLTRDLLIAIAGLLAAGLVTITLLVRHELTETFDETLRAQAVAVSALTEYEDGRIHFDFTEDFLSDFVGTHPERYFEVRSGSSVLARSESLGDQDLPELESGTLQTPRFWKITLPNGHSGRAVALNYRLENIEDEAPAVSPHLRVVVASSSEELEELFSVLWVGLAVCAVLLSVVVFFVVPRVLRRGLAPVERLGIQAATIDARSLALRFEVSELPVELRPIADRLNDLLARLEESFERERQVSADLAHELRTPVAELRMLAESALRWPDSHSTTTDEDTLAIALHLESIVQHMLALARGEFGPARLNCEPIELADLLRRAWRPFESAARDKALRVSFSLEPCRVFTDPAFLRSIATNLFDNAVEYAPRDTTVTITCGVEGDQAKFTIRNATEDLEPKDIPHLFDRFWRKEQSRQQGAREHTGLGLSLVRAFARSIGWKTVASLDERRRILVTIEGPMETRLESEGEPGPSGRARPVERKPA